MQRDPLSVHEVFADAARRTPHAPFLCTPARPGRSWLPGGVEISYGEMAERVDRLTVAYARAGFGLGHRVALLLENRPVFFEHYLALNALGSGIVPVNPDYRQDELAYLLAHSNVDLAVAITERCADLAAAASGRAKPLALVDAGDPSAAIPSPAGRAGDWQAGIDAECSLMYTSGTTGRPKACILTNRYYLEAGRWYRDLGGLATIHHGRDRIYNPLPLYHMNAQAVTATMAMLTGNCIVVPERFSPSRWWSEVVETRATVIHYLGVVPPLLLGQPASTLDRGHQVRFGLGAGVEPQLHGAFEDRFGFPLVEIWGMTETGRIFAVTTPPRLIDTRAFGRPEAGRLEAKIVDAEDRELPRGSEGELVVRWGGAEGPRHGFFTGYLDNDAATRDAWRGGWFHTGDTVRQDSEGMLFFVDRSKNMIRRAGENIAAAEVEAVLQSAPWVAQVAVVACPDELREAEVLACIVPRDAPADAALARALHDFAAARLAYYKAPGWVLFTDHLPTTGTQKIQKHQIFERDEDPRSRPGIHDLRHLKRRR